MDYLCWSWLWINQKLDLQRLKCAVKFCRVGWHLYLNYCLLLYGKEYSKEFLITVIRDNSHTCHFATCNGILLLPFISFKSIRNRYIALLCGVPRIYRSFLYSTISGWLVWLYDLAVPNSVILHLRIKDFTVIWNLLILFINI